MGPGIRLQALFAFTFLFLAGCSMADGLPGDLKKQLGDIPAFNRKHSGDAAAFGPDTWPSAPLEGINLKGATFAKVAFVEGKISRSRFTDCHFKNCDFQHFAFVEAEFVNCRFDDCENVAGLFENCRFKGGTFSGGSLRSEDEGPGETRFDSAGFEGTTFANVRMKNTVFGNSLFDSVHFESVRWQDAMIESSRLTAPRFKGSLSGKLLLRGCLMEKPAISPNDLQELQYTGTVITGMHLAPVSSMGHPGFGVTGATFKQSTFDLKGLGGHFGLSGAEDCAVENFHAKNNLGLEGEYRHVTFRDIKVGEADFMSDAVLEDVRFEGLEAGVVFMQEVRLRNCVFKDLIVRKMFYADSSTFENVKWENAKLDPKVKYSAKGTPFEAKPPF